MKPMKSFFNRTKLGIAPLAAVAVASGALLLPAAAPSPSTRIWAGDYKGVRWEATASGTEDGVCVDLELTGRAEATSGGCGLGPAAGGYVGYFADSNCDVDTTWVVAPAHPAVARVEMTGIVNELRTVERFDYARVVEAPEGFGAKFVLGFHPRYAYLDSMVVFDEQSSVLEERRFGLDADHDWTPQDFCPR